MVEPLESRSLLAAFTAGNLVIYRVGATGTDLAATGSPVFLDEYTPAGSLVQSVALPTTTSGAQRSFTRHRRRILGSREDQAGAAAWPAPLRSATSSTMSPIMRLISKSFGV